MFDFPVNPRHAALIAAADDYAMDQAALSRNQARRSIIDSAMLSSLPGQTLACDICDITIDDDTIHPVLLWKGHVLTASDVLWLVDLGFDYSRIASLVS